MKDYYYILGIDSVATLQQIKVAYRKLAIKFHPDKNKGDKFFSDHFREIQEAYEVLSNPEKRRAYDIAHSRQGYKQQDIHERQETFRQSEEELRRRSQQEARETNKRKPKGASSYAFNSSIVKETSRDGRFIAYDNGTVLDTRTNLMWVAKDNAKNTDWYCAKSFCENYRGGSYTDWRMPIRDELAGLYDVTNLHERNGYHFYMTDLIEITHPNIWVNMSRDLEAPHFSFTTGQLYWFPQSHNTYGLALPVRNAK